MAKGEAAHDLPGPPAPLAALLKAYRGNAGLSHEQLAERAGISARTVSDLERGLIQLPWASTLQRLVEALSRGAGAFL